ncbi:ribosomal protection-like ABC-F family protein [Lactococcus garvieae]|uniref:ABC transporter ATP-binding protein n=1 Tax=Lactococcus garvieae DCC43 TaxID=1231377 RepID=K2QB59_9LACT|nr:ABC-F type ribosomal protection protein [Lactococcus garvieae]EKF50752.1 ABC transporter ATP-binding protein [Lactococcus garvieae DCC43]
MSLALELKNVKVSFKDQDIVDIEHLMVYEGEKIGIVGANGQGKSTLLNLISGQLNPDYGKIERHIDFEYLRQIGSEAVDDLDYEWLSRMQVPAQDYEHLSGGQQRKFMLSQVLAQYPQGLLLDEPTTHLDKESMEDLAKEVRYYYGTILLVSHDRSFLNATVEKIWEIAEGRVTVYNGNYQDYIEAKEKAALETVRYNEKLAKEKALLERAIATKEAKIAQQADNVAKNLKRAIKPDRYSATKSKDSVQKAAQRQVKAMNTRLGKLGSFEKLEEERELKFPLSPSLVLHNKFPIMADGLTVKAGKKVLLDRINFQFPLGKVIVLSGPNGSGKSSLLRKIITGDKHLTLSPKLKIASYGQLDYDLHSELPLLLYLTEQSDYDESFIRSLLVQLGFNHSQMRTSVNKLSGGQATKVILAQTFIQPSNLLILDEPTNFIDLETIEALEKFIHSYPGTIILTSHDTAFVNKVADVRYEILDQKLRQMD